MALIVHIDPGHIQFQHQDVLTEIDKTIPKGHIALNCAFYANNQQNTFSCLLVTEEYGICAIDIQSNLCDNNYYNSHHKTIRNAVLSKMRGSLKIPLHMLPELSPNVVTYCTQPLPRGINNPYLVSDLPELMSFITSRPHISYDLYVYLLPIMAECIQFTDSQTFNFKPDLMKSFFDGQDQFL